MDIFEENDTKNPEDEYPPIGTPETAIVIVINCDNYEVVDYTGRFFHAQIGCAGFHGEEIGITNVPDSPGVYVMDNGKPWEGKDWETGIVDDYGIEGDWRLATKEDFKRFDVDPLFN